MDCRFAGNECFVAHHWEKLEVKLADGAKIRYEMGDRNFWVHRKGTEVRDIRNGEYLFRVETLRL